MTPIQEDHVAKALDLVISQYAGKPVLQGVITSYMNRMNVLEATVYQIIAAFDLLTAPPVGAALDIIASIVGEDRNGQTDAQLWATVQARISANKSRGNADSIIATANFFGLTSYFEKNGTWEITFTNGAPQTPENVLRILDLARAAGYRGLVVYGPTYPQLPAVWGDVVSGAPLVPGWPSDVTGLIPGYPLPGLAPSNAQQVG